MSFQHVEMFASLATKTCKCPSDPQKATKKHEAECFDTAKSNTYVMYASAWSLISEQMKKRDDNLSELQKRTGDKAAAYFE